MRPSIRRSLPFVFLVATACGGSTFRWQPSLTSHVPDSTTVRFNLARNEPHVVGRSIDWQRGKPRLVTSRGDTVVVPDSARLEVRLKNKTNHAVAGGMLGLAVGFGVAFAACSSESCSEQALTPYLVGALGALLGSAFKTDQWVRVRVE